MGWAAAVPGQVSEQFIAFARGCRRRVVDIGCAYGVVAIPAGAIAVDLEMGHLRAIPLEVPGWWGGFRIWRSGRGALMLCMPRTSCIF
jgi:hypothetical protein